MEPKIWFWIGGGLIAIIALLILGVFFIRSSAGRALTAIPPQSIDTSCSVDANCKLISTTCCTGCVSLEQLGAANVDWEPSCPRAVQCQECLRPASWYATAYAAVCDAGTCVVRKNS